VPRSIGFAIASQNQAVRLLEGAVKYDMGVEDGARRQFPSFERDSGLADTGYAGRFDLAAVTAERLLMRPVLGEAVAQNTDRNQHEEHGRYRL
jgi:hypothetical protein